MTKDLLLSPRHFFSPHQPFSFSAFFIFCLSFCPLCFFVLRLSSFVFRFNQPLHLIRNILRRIYFSEFADVFR